MKKKKIKISDNELKNILINPKLNKRGQYICDCPFCGKESHFYISKETQLWDCKKCGEFGSIIKLLKQLDKIYLLQGSTIEIKEKIESLRSLIDENETEDIELKELPTIKMPIKWRLYDKPSIYLKSRKISTEDIKRYNIGYSNILSKYQNYLLIPIYDNGKIKGFIGRYANKKVPKDKLRYNNSFGTEFASLLFGYDEIIKGKTTTVILVEGIFDKIAVDKFLKLYIFPEIKCVCTFGKKISDVQIKKLLIKDITNIILLYDFDALKEIKKIGLELQEHFITNITYTKKKDIDECNLEEALEVFDNLQKPNDFYYNVIEKIKR